MTEPAGQPHGFRFDVLVAGAPARRGVAVIVSPFDLRFDGEQVQLRSVFWVSRRAGLVMVFAKRHTLAFFGDPGDLDELARRVELGAEPDHRRTLLRPMSAEGVVQTAGTAVTGHIGRARVAGLCLSVFTRRALHLFVDGQQYTLRWPMERADHRSGPPPAEGDDRPVLELAGSDAELTLHYLCPEEIPRIIEIATGTPQPDDAERALEMFNKGEVARPPAGRPPEFSGAATTLQSACEAAVGEVTLDPSIGERLNRRFFEKHLQSLGAIIFGPLMVRRSAALAAESLRDSIEVMEAGRLRAEASVALENARRELARVFGDEVHRVVRARRLDGEHAQKALKVMRESSLQTSMNRHLESVDPALNLVVAREQRLLEQLDARDLAPPDADEAALERAVSSWRGRVAQLDVAYGEAGAEILREIATLWSDRLIPALRGLTALRGRRLSEKARLAILAVATFLAIAVATWFAQSWIF